MSAVRRCGHAEHQDAYRDDETGWVILDGKKEAWVHRDWVAHVKLWASHYTVYQRRRMRANAYRRMRYATDPEFRQKEIERNRAIRRAA